MLTVGYLQKQSIVILHKIKKVKITGTGQQATIIIVKSIAQRIIIGIEIPRSFQQAHLVHHPFLTEQLHHFGGMLLKSFEWQVLGNDFLHTLLHAHHIIQTDCPVELQAAIISFRHRMFQYDTTIRIEVFHSLTQNEAQGAHIGSHPRRTSDVLKFHILVVIQPESQAFHLVVDLCTDRSIGQIKPKTGINVQK